MRKLLVAAAILVTASAAVAQQMPAVAVSPDGATVLAAGDNRVLYTLDAETLSVTARRYIPGLVRWMDYSADGRNVFIRTDDRTFTARAANSFKTRYRFEDIFAVSYAPAADRIALLENGYKAGVLHILVASTGEVLRRLEFPDIDTEIVALSEDGERVLILTGSERSDDEPNESPSSDLKGYDRYLFRQKNDGYVSTVVSVNVGDGSWATAPTYYRVSFPSQVRMIGDKMMILKGTSDSAFVSADGTTELMDLGSGYMAEGRVNDDGATLTLTGGTEIKLHPLAGTAAGEMTFEVDAGRIDGPGERVTAMDEAADGAVYMVTSAYRIWKLVPGADAVKGGPVF